MLFLSVGISFWEVFRVRQNALSFLAGLLFSLGLGVSGMVQPEKVKSFLDFFGNWDPSLAFVMIGAIATHLICYRRIKKRKAPLLGGHFHWPTKKDLDLRLILGALIFGVGWGIIGFCPGPAIVSLAAFNKSAFVFVLAMLGGMMIYTLMERIILLFSPARKSLVSQPLDIRWLDRLDKASRLLSLDLDRQTNRGKSSRPNLDKSVPHSEVFHRTEKDTRREAHR